ncbi:hypothetical protein ABH940_006678 [Streptacidiphilus sp. BW17]
MGLEGTATPLRTSPSGVAAVRVARAYVGLAVAKVDAFFTKHL